METINSFKGYGKVDPLQQEEFRKKTRKRLIIVAVSLVVLAALIVGVAVGTVVHKKNKGGGNDDVPSTSTSPVQSIRAVCAVTNYPDSCFTSISEVQNSTNGGGSSDPEKIFQISLQVSLNALQKLSKLPEKLSNSSNDPLLKTALSVCETVFDDAIDMLNESISSINPNSGEKLFTTTKISDLRTWLSTTLTDQETCLDALEEVNATIINDVRNLMKNSTEFASNSLAIVTKLLGILKDFHIPVHRKLLGTTNSAEQGSKFPEWVRAADRRLLQETYPKPDVVVAADGTGDVKTVKEAIDKVPKKSITRFVIYVKAGEYKEQLIMDKSYWNVMMYGDGMTKSIITHDDNNIAGTRTFDTATVGK